MADPATPDPVRRIRTSELVRGVLGRALHPIHLYRAIQLHRARKAHRHAFDDAQLDLYGKILPGEFLHYGYFDDPNRSPEEMSFQDIARAQIRYAEMLVDLVGPQPAAVLDIGCGMGGLCRMLADKGHLPVALTPDRLQAAHIVATQPQVPVMRCKFEKLVVAEHREEYSAAITSESLQYLKLDHALPMMSAILKPGGKWIASDYFAVHASGDRSCHAWTEFQKRISAAGWRVMYERDITAHVLPTLAYVHMWAVRFGIPFFELGALRLRRKQPGLHHLLENMLDVLRGVAADNLRRVDPQWFAQHRKYMLLVMEKPAT